VRRTTVFTTHTPVPAGHDAFPFQLVEQHLAGCWGDLGEHRDAFLALGMYDNGGGSQFNLTALAMRSSGFTNAVSKLHRDVTADMWKPLWAEKSGALKPVTAITNGVHVPTWVSPPMAALYDRFLGHDWRERTNDPGFWDAVARIPDEDLWAARQLLRNDLFSFVRERARLRWAGEHASPQRVLAGGTLFDPNALTIGFARRFTSYKRPELIFHDVERLSRILNQARRPVQIVFAGKAHPADDMGKHHLHAIFLRAVDPLFGGRVAFVDDYDLHVAHYLVSGVDVWLNNPRKPLEASGTSGMKAAINGVPHLSIGDGWWAEGFNGSNGWLIEGRTEDPSPDAVDAADASALYALLEHDVVPAFYQRDRHGISTRWLDVVRQSIRTVTPRFSARRMLIDYVEHAYAPAYEASTKERVEG
jgi:starch phosphorylase